MKGIICYFSLTGNTKLACEYIDKKISNVTFEYYDITTDEEPNFSAYDLIGFATYTDFFEPGQLMKTYMQNFNGDGKLAFVFNTYGQMSGNTLFTMAQTAKSSNLKVIEAYSLHVPENYPPLIKNGTTNEEYPRNNDLESFNEFITNLNSKVTQLSNGGTITEKNIKKSIFISVTKKLLSIINMDKMGVKNVHKDQCTGCGICASVCPYDAISMVDGYPKFDESKCESCFACYNMCPTKSIYTPKLDGVGHYNKPHKNLIEKLK
ncbi:EFR1 family ferrodoxin [Clostridiaceae bacterium HSG29]|nr:EFR1 family ferrodoxin [Clostridiaceae bacterium HSG29]